MGHFMPFAFAYAFHERIIDEFHVKSSPWQQGAGGKISLKMNDIWEWIFYQVQTIPVTKFLQK